MSRQQSRSAFSTQNKTHTLIKQLLQIWSQNQIEERYQNYFLAYLDTLGQRNVQIAITQQIKLTLQHKSYYYLIQNGLKQHDKIIQMLKRTIELCKHKTILQSDIQMLCQILGELRSCNLNVAEITLKFNTESLANTSSSFLICGNNYVFNKLNADNQFLKQTFLAQHIAFTNSFDPFFLEHFQTSKKERSDKKDKQGFQWIINQSISKIYRLMKAQEQMLSFLSGKIPSRDSTHKKKRLNYHLIEDTQRSEEGLSPSRFKNDKRIQYMQEQSYEPEPIYQRSKTEGINLSSIMFKEKKSNNSNLNSSQLGFIKNQKELLNNSKVQKYFLPQIQNKKMSLIQSKHKYTANSFTSSASQKKKPLINENKFDKSYTLNESVYTNNSANKYIIPKLTNRKYYTTMHEEDYRNPGYKEQENIFQQPEEQKEQISHNNSAYEEQKNVEAYRQILGGQIDGLERSSLKKNIRLKSCKLDLKNAIICLKEANIKQQYKNPFQITKWEQSLKNHQYYMLKFYVNDNIEAIALCLAVANGQIMIKYWGPFKTCSQETSNYLFQKCLQYIQKNTPFKKLYYNGPSYIPQIYKHNFIRNKIKDSIFYRQRLSPPVVQMNDYAPFLSVTFSSISISKHLQNYSRLMNKQAGLDEMNEQSFLSVNYLLIVNKLLTPGIFSEIGTYTGNYKSLSEVKTKLIKEGIYSNAYNTQFRIQNTNLLTIKLITPLKHTLFVANYSIIKMQGDLIYKQDNILIVCVYMQQCNSKLYFCKGEESMINLHKIIKQYMYKNNKKKMEFVVNMFKKMLRGRLFSVNLKDEYCFGDCQIKFQWKDYLQGHIYQDFDQYQLFGDSNFYCLLQIDEQILFGFQITKQNLL